MRPEHAREFHAEESTLEAGAYVFETYWFECSGDPFVAAAAIASEHSTAQWNRPGVDEDYRPAHGAKVVRLEVLETSGAPLLPVSGSGAGPYSRCRARIANPHVNFGPRIPNLLTACMGEGAFFAPNVAAVKLEDVEFPDVFLDFFEGPRFGVEGFREILGARGRPVFFGVVKPNVGLAPADFAELAFQSWMGGLDAPKDDEMLADTSYSPLASRVRILGEMKKKAEDATGRRLMYVANVTDEVSEILRLHDVAVAAGINAVMLNGMAVGLSAVRMLAKRSAVPVVGHFDCIAPMTRVPWFGVSTTLITRLQRMAGFDAIIMPGFGGRMFTQDVEVLANVRECLRPLGKMKPCLPVPGGSDWAGTLEPTFRKLNTTDFGFVPGRGVFGHPGGPKAGARSIVDAWDAIARGVSAGERARTSPELAAALAHFT